MVSEVGINTAPTSPRSLSCFITQSIQPPPLLPLEPPEPPFTTAAAAYESRSKLEKVLSDIQLPFFKRMRLASWIELKILGNLKLAAAYGQTG
ncbi:hypothetical protein LOK49_LG04G02327 [Camellia lanceoleosa]|uniref:Uncharacterized protein n=1 Tax=Camellia lanceoleosa TaxID=1840588 RepID=A0ACC0HV16_9ERIC|nr:hypothetical protein LOK49_LG04G02327 [Camellia lanceoleosa]